MRRSTTVTVLPLAILALGWAAPASVASVDMGGMGHGGEKVWINLNPLNDSGASGTAMVTVNQDGSLTVHIEGSGYTSGRPHAQHLHGGMIPMRFGCPTAEDDENGDGIVTTEEGLPDFGGVHISLTTKGDTSEDSALDLDRMPVADADGDLSYDRTIAASAVPEGTLDQLDHLHVVQHGIDVNGNDRYDMAALGKSSFAESMGMTDVPEEATAPATCGMPVPRGAVDAGVIGSDPVEPAQSPQSLLLITGGLAVLGAGAAFAARSRLASSGS